jgi:hypothetical protein
MEKFEKIKSLMVEAEQDMEKFYEKGNKSAGTRIRKAMQELKKLAQEVRQDVQDTKNAS